MAGELDESAAAWVEAQRTALAQLLEARMAPPPDGDPGRLVESMRYSLLAPGKRIRPLLALAAADAVGTIDDNVRLAAPGGFTGERFLEQCSPSLGSEGAGVEGVHVFTFNQIAETEAWRQDLLAKIS